MVSFQKQAQDMMGAQRHTNTLKFARQRNGSFVNTVRGLSKQIEISRSMNEDTQVNDHTFVNFVVRHLAIQVHILDIKKSANKNFAENNRLKRRQSNQIPICQYRT